MSKRSRLLRRIRRLETKLAITEMKLDNARLEYNYWVAMEDDSEDWEE